MTEKVKEENLTEDEAAPTIKMPQVKIPEFKNDDSSRKVETSSAEREGLRQMREILFSNQMAQVERHLETIQLAFAEMVSKAQEEAKRDNASLEARLRDEIKSLREELAAEKAERNKALEDVVETTTKATTALQEQFVATTDQIEEEKVDRALLAQMFRHISKRFT